MQISAGGFSFTVYNSGLRFAFCALIQLVGHQEQHPAYKEGVIK